MRLSSVKEPSTDQECLELCAGLLAQAIKLLSADLTPEDRSHGWTTPKRRQLRGLVETWQGEINTAKTVADVQAKIMGRWFLDHNVDYGPISELLAQTDNAIYDAKNGPWETSWVPEVGKQDGLGTYERRLSPFFRPPKP